MTHPQPHYDEDDTCQCPDHRALRAERAARLAEAMGDSFIGDSSPAANLARAAVERGSTPQPRQRPLRTVITGLPEELMTHPPKDPISVTFIRIDYTLGIAYYMYVGPQEG